MPDKLIDAEAAKAAIWKARLDATETWEALSHLDEARRQCSAVVQTCDRLLAALDALPDASEKPQQAGDGAEEE